MKCKNCGNEVESQSKFCTYCGSEITSDTQNFNGNVNVSNVNNVNQVNLSNNTNRVDLKKKKVKWWIPVLLIFVFPLIIFLIPTVLNIIIFLLLGSNLSSYSWYSLLNGICVFLPIISFLAGIVSIPIVIAKHESSGNKQNYNLSVNNYINSNASLDDKLLVSYIGNNYDKIMNKDFSLSACFLCVWYLCYRKIYLLAIAIAVFNSLVIMFVPFLSFLSFVIIIASGCLFNKTYVKYARKRINKIKQENPNATEADLIKLARKKGGVSPFGLVLYIIASVLIFIIYVVILISANLKSATLSCSKTYDNGIYATVEMTYDKGSLTYMNQRFTFSLSDSSVSYQDMLQSFNEYSENYYGCDVNALTSGDRVIFDIDCDFQSMSELNKSNIGNLGTYSYNKSSFENEGYVCE